MSTTTAEHIVQRLSEWGVERVFGPPGDGSKGLLGARERERDRDRLQFVQVRHEEMAALRACGHARWTGDVGVRCATSGPGAIHLLNGLYDAKLDHQPVVAVVGQTCVRAMGGQYQQEVDLAGALPELRSGGALVPARAPVAADDSVAVALASRPVLVSLDRDRRARVLQALPHEGRRLQLQCWE